MPHQPLSSAPLQHTLDHRHCPACEFASNAAMADPTFAQLPFAAAAPLWLDSRSRIAERTRSDYQEHFRRLLPFFGALLLHEVRIGHVNEYRAQRRRQIAARSKRNPDNPGASRINHEISTLQQILKRARCWAKIAPWYEPYPQPKTSPGIALEPAQEERLFRVARSRKRWKVAYCCALISANTAAGPGEIRGLQLKDVNLVDRALYIREGAKNKFRERGIPLNEDALWAARQLVERATEMGATEPEHYLLPHRAAALGGKPDPCHPSGGWRTAWCALRKAAGLLTLRPYDLRHHAITRMLEHPEISERTVIELAGHVSGKMLARYSHLRAAARREAVDALNGKRAPASERPGPQILEKERGA